MSNAAASQVLEPEPATELYECSANGCVEPTAGHYCARHTTRCESCRGEYERGTLLRGLCDGCVRAAVSAPACCDRSSTCECDVDFWGMR